MAILVDDERELEHYIQVLEMVTKSCGLTINVKKTKLWKGNWEVANGGTTLKCHDAHPHYYSCEGNWGGQGF
jgi:hypothetical protein